MKNGDYSMYSIKDSGSREHFDTGAVRDIQESKGRFDLVPMQTLAALAIHYELGCKKYGDRNWEKGIPVQVYLNSAMRHTAKTMAGLRDENHLISAIWNLFCAYETILRIQNGELSESLYDMPKKVCLPNPWSETETPVVEQHPLQDQANDDYWNTLGCEDLSKEREAIEAECTHPEAFRVIRTSTVEPGDVYEYCQVCGQEIK
jgi:hypothetical protein